MYLSEYASAYRNTQSESAAQWNGHDLRGGGRAGSLVHLETIRDDKRANAAAMGVMERYTVVHESGHQFLLEHVDGYSPPGDDVNPAGDYIMTNVLDQTGMAPNVVFSPISLKKLRESAYPPQGD